MRSFKFFRGLNSGVFNNTNDTSDERTLEENAEYYRERHRILSSVPQIYGYEFVGIGPIIFHPITFQPKRKLIYRDTESGEIFSRFYVYENDPLFNIREVTTI